MPYHRNMVAALLLYASLVNDVRSLLAHNDFATAERVVRTYEAQAGATPEAAAALSWLARGALDAGDYNRADSYAGEARSLTDQILHTRKLDSDPNLPIALGAAIEVHAGALAARGQRSEAILYLHQQLRLFATTSLAERIQKNINLLSLEGKPAPPIQAADFLGARPPTLAALRGHPVLLFFWAHWCPDCKAEVPILADLMRIYAPRGLVLIGPTRFYGYVEGGESAGPAEEKRYIEKVKRQYYAPLAAMTIPLDATDFQRYGSSTTPTLVLIDRQGIVRYYHPGAAPESELASRIQQVFAERRP
jgi:thiol-disulfide isomerase/thioredoxin